MFKNHEALAGLAMVLTGLIFFLAAFSIDILDDGGAAPRLFPMAASLLIAALGCLQFFYAPSPDNAVVAASQTTPLLALIALSVGYTLGVTWFGYLVATAVAAPVAFYLFGIRSKAGLLCAFFLCPVIFHLVFFYGLGVFPPYGLWFDLLDVIQA